MFPSFCGNIDGNCIGFAEHQAECQGARNIVTHL
ncbi:hypothetical protein predicted by Glimmer/Critica [Lactiplantibacillus plantarum]|nr:hypothetical protein predicted by Glimmer/Critica [Lactiplantibacillus plantarum]